MCPDVSTRVRSTDKGLLYDALHFLTNTKGILYHVRTKVRPNQKW